MTETAQEASNRAIADHNQIQALQATNKKLASLANILATQCEKAGIKITIEGKEVKQAIAEAEGK